jgi:hypothetical protein
LNEYPGLHRDYTLEVTDDLGVDANLLHAKFDFFSHGGRSNIHVTLHEVNDLGEPVNKDDFYLTCET